MPDKPTNSNLRLKLEAIANLLGEGEVVRSMKLFDKFNAIGLGPTAFCFLVTVIFTRHRENIKSALDALEKIYEEYEKGKDKQGTLEAIRLAMEKFRNPPQIPNVPIDLA